MRKPIVALAIALGLWLAPGALAGDRGTLARTSVQRATPATTTLADARRGTERSLTWLGRNLSLVLGLATPTQPVFVTFGISDEPDPTSSRDRARAPGFGGSKGGSRSGSEAGDAEPPSSSETSAGASLAGK